MSNVDSEGFFDTLEEVDPELEELYHSASPSTPVDEYVWRTVKEVEDEGEEEEDIDEQRDETPAVKRRVKGLLKNQFEIIIMQSEMAKELQAIEAKYAEMTKPLQQKRLAIIKGEYEPTDHECDLTGITDDKQENLDTLVEKMTLVDEPLECEDSSSMGAEAVKGEAIGVPKFWLEVFQSSSVMISSFEDEDIEIFKYLENVSVDMLKDQMGYTLNFHFLTNPFFINRVLTKTFITSCEIKPHKALNLLEKAWPVKEIGCEIFWLEGKNVTYKQIQRRQKNRRNVRFVTITMKCHSFFTFFDTIETSPNGTNLGSVDSDAAVSLQDNFMTGEFIRRRIIPYAALFYSGLLDEDVVLIHDGCEDDLDEEEESGAGRKRLRNGRIISVEFHPKNGGNGTETGLNADVVD